MRQGDVLQMKKYITWIAMIILLFCGLRAPIKAIAAENWKDKVSVKAFIDDTELTNQTTVSLNDTIRLEYKISLGGDGISTKTTDSSITYELGTLSSYLTNTFPISISAGGIAIGKVSCDGAGNITFQYADTLKDQPENTLRDITFMCETSLKASEVGSDKTIDIDFSGVGGTGTTIKVDENQDKPPVIEKSNGVCNTELTEMTWTITLTMKGIDYSSNGFTVKDTFARGLTFKDGSLTITKMSPDVSLGVEGTVDTVVNADKTTTLSFSFKPPAGLVSGDKIQIQYVTKISDSLKVGDLTKNEAYTNTTTVDNKVSLLDNSNNKELGSDESTGDVVKTLNQWMQKTSTAGKLVGGTKYDTWEVVIDTNGYYSSMETLFLHDQLGNGMEYVAGTARYKIDSAAYNPISSGFAYAGGYLNGETGLNLKTLAGSSASKITICYQTKIDNWSTVCIEDRVPQNKAWLTWSWKDFYGPEPGTFSKVGPTISKPASQMSGVLAKSGVYEAKSHSITWKITYNQDNQSLASVVLKDYIQTGQKYIDDSVQVEPAVSGVSVTDSSSADVAAGSSVDFTVTGTGSNEVTISFKTEITDKDFFANNVKSKTFRNTASM